MTKDGQEKLSLADRLSQKTQTLNQAMSSEESFALALASRVTSLLTSLESEVSAKAQTINASLTAISKTWLKRAMMLIGGCTIVCLLTLLIAAWMLNRNLSTKRTEIARLEQSIADRKVTLETQQADYDKVQREMQGLKMSQAARDLINESLSFGTSTSGVEVYLMEGWTTQRCELTNGSRIDRCIRRD